MSDLAAYIAVLLVAHFIGDFVCQTHWQASNKSKDIRALGRHVLSYTAVLAAATFFLLGPTPQWIGFVAANHALHFLTDYCTSRWSSRLFKLAVRDTHWVMTYEDNLKASPSEAEMRMYDARPGARWHNFFVVIGFDQLVHGLTLLATLEAFR